MWCNMARGLLFDIKELSIHDGPGPRITVFLKGCPLRCQWCHNPEGLAFEQELMVKTAQCLHCGLCKKPCDHAECQPFQRCLHACPKGLISLCGEEVDAEQLAKQLLGYRDFLMDNGGGITFSGGEPLAQPEFLLALLQKTKPLHRAIQTSGYVESPIFEAALEHIDYVMLDIKHTDNVIHKQYTGVDNALILKNLELLKKSGKPFVIRIPLIPGINDAVENLENTAILIKDAKALVRVELLPYNPFAGSKYPMVGKKFALKFDEQESRPIDLSLFKKHGVEAVIL